MQKIKTLPVAISLGLLFLISFILCVLYGLIVPSDWQMYPLWVKLLPGFHWLNWGSFFLGLIESFIYGFYIAYITIPLYNFFAIKLNSP